jgi:predicted O-methyltransferase YrrM
MAMEFFQQDKMEFNQDPVVSREVQQLIKKFNIACVVETGTYVGWSTQFFAQLPNVKKVYTIESQRENYDKAADNLKQFTNIQQLFGSSDTVLEEQLSVITNEHNEGYILFYLDAHWDNHWPLLQELEVIGKYCYDRAIIVIDDFQVPLRNFQYDSYHSQPNNFQYVCGKLQQCYSPDKWLHYYNDHSERCRQPVGKLYVIPKIETDINEFKQEDDNLYSRIK